MYLGKMADSLGWARSLATSAAALHAGVNVSVASIIFSYEVMVDGSLIDSSSSSDEFGCSSLASDSIDIVISLDSASLVRAPPDAAFDAAFEDS